MLALYENLLLPEAKQSFCNTLGCSPRLHGNGERVFTCVTQPKQAECCASSFETRKFTAGRQLPRPSNKAHKEDIEYDSWRSSQLQKTAAHVAMRCQLYGCSTGSTHCVDSSQAAFKAAMHQMASKTKRGQFSILSVARNHTLTKLATLMTFEEHTLVYNPHFEHFNCVRTPR
ncbi:unnamed protein product [Peronospora belbahrii]|uniref:Uncharacterized protein n=1 Tax=Peronospora belbahrii TaxID=622444 RepID=A0ABN8D1H0_9STRA|nr:unnamed protein product [Peronospora belbahrii]